MIKKKLLLIFIICFVPFLVIRGKTIVIERSEIKKMAVRNTYDLLSRISELYSYTYGGTGQKTYIKRPGLPEGNLDVYLDGFLISETILSGKNDGLTNLADLSIEYIEKVEIELNSPNNINGEIRIFTRQNFDAKQLTTEIFYRDAFLNHRNLSFIVNQKYSDDVAFSVFTDVTDFQDYREEEDARFKNPYHKEQVELKITYPFFNRKSTTNIKYFRKKISEIPKDSSFYELKSYTLENKTNIFSNENIKFQFLTKVNETRLDSSNLQPDSISNHYFESGINLDYQPFTGYLLNYKNNYVFQDFYSMRKSFSFLKNKLELNSLSNTDITNMLLNKTGISYTTGSKNFNNFGLYHQTSIPVYRNILFTNENRYLNGTFYSNYNSNSEELITENGIREKSELLEHDFYFHFKDTLKLKNEDFKIKLSCGIDYLNILNLTGNDSLKAKLVSKEGEITFANIKTAIEMFSGLKLNVNYYQRITQAEIGSTIYNPDYTISSNLNYTKKLFENELTLYFEINHLFSNYNILNEDNSVYNNMKFNNLNFQISVTILNFEIFFGSDNFLSNKFNLFDQTEINMNDNHIYQTIGGYKMPKRNEIWGVRWIFRR